MNSLRKNLLNIQLLLRTTSLTRRSELEVKGPFFVSLFDPLQVSSPRQHLTIPSTIHSSNDSEVHSQDLPTGYHYKVIKGKIGSGHAYFLRASERLQQCRLPPLIPWLETHFYGKEIGNSLVVHAQFFSLPLWTLNPCKIVEKKQSENQSLLVVSGLEGHVLTGEDTFLVSYDPKTEDVSLQLSTCSKVNAWIGHLLLPFVRKLQIKFLRGNLQAFRSI